jgi:hypothetical protein
LRRRSESEGTEEGRERARRRRRRRRRRRECKNENAAAADFSLKASFKDAGVVVAFE